MAAPTLAIGNPQLSTVSRRPQSTAAPGGGGPFTRHSREARLLGFQLTAQAFGANIVQPLKPVAGYLRSLDLLIRASGGSGSTTNATAAADAPENAISLLLLRDPFGQPIFQCDGYALRKINAYGGQTGFWQTADPENLPSFSEVATTGNFTERLRIPLELIRSDGYCSLPALNAASVPQLQITLAAAGTVFTTSPSPTVPTVEVRVDENFWAVPIDDPNLAPPGVGSSAQWSQAVSALTIGSAATVRVALPRVGTWIHTIILILRDSANARVDAMPDPVEFWIDGVPIFQEPLPRREDLMFEQSGLGRAVTGFSTVLDNGILVYSFRDSAFAAISSADTADLWLHTTPGTLLEFGGTFGTIGSAPGTLTVVTGEIYPIDGIPYHALAA